MNYNELKANDIVMFINATHKDDVYTCQLSRDPELRPNATGVPFADKANIELGILWATSEKDLRVYTYFTLFVRSDIKYTLIKRGNEMMTGSMSLYH